MINYKNDLEIKSTNFKKDKNKRKNLMIIL